MAQWTQSGQIVAVAARRNNNRGADRASTAAGSIMLKLPPPIWAIIYILLCTALSWSLGWPRFPGLPLPPLGMALVAIAFVPPVWALVLFRREGTEIEPTSPANRVLVTRGPYRFTRNPMYLGLVVLSLGIAIWVGAWPMFIAPIAVFATANWVHIPFEEAKMRRQFGAAYDGYVARVRRWV
jgi:protein-S-isoprenylcysteine O-methyltransferase Ste14